MPYKPERWAPGSAAGGWGGDPVWQAAAAVTGAQNPSNPPLLPFPRPWQLPPSSPSLHGFLKTPMLFLCGWGFGGLLQGIRMLQAPRIRVGGVWGSWSWDWWATQLALQLQRPRGALAWALLIEQSLLPVKALPRRACCL